jgi:hypothetical protein
MTELAADDDSIVSIHGGVFMFGGSRGIPSPSACWQE